MDLADWLLAHIAEDELAAQRGLVAAVVELDSNIERSWLGQHYDRWSPARVLAECEAKRAIAEARQMIDAHVRQIALTDQDEARNARNTRAGLDVALKALALPYADHESYREEWKP